MPATRRESETSPMTLGAGFAFLWILLVRTRGARNGDGVPLNPIGPATLHTIDLVRKIDARPNRNRKGRKYVYGAEKDPGNTVIAVPIFVARPYYLHIGNKIHLRNIKGEIGLLLRLIPQSEMGRLYKSVLNIVLYYRMLPYFCSPFFTFQSRLIAGVGA